MSTKRISGLHVDDDGTVGVVWLDLDPVSRNIGCYDCALFDRGEMFELMASAIGGRGRNIPLAWRKQDKAFADKLLETGIDVLPDPCEDTPAMVEVGAREIRGLMRAKRFFFKHDFPEMRREHDAFNRTDGKVPAQGFPLMAATRHALDKLEWARAETFGSRKSCAPELRPV